MKNKKVEATLGMMAGKTFNGLNMNVLKYLMPVWIAPLSGVTLRCVVAAVCFWIMSAFVKSEPRITGKERLSLFLLGALGIYGFMFFYLVGLSKTTPVSSSIFSSLQPIWVFLIAVFFFKERMGAMKVIGIALGLGGALLCILAQKSNDLASDALTGNLLCLCSSIVYAIYLVISKRLLKTAGVYTVLKYTFSGAAFSGLVVTSFTGFHAPVFDAPFHWVPLGLMIFMLIFPTVLSYLFIPIGLKYLKTTVVAIYGYLILVVATVVSLIVGQDRFSWAQAIAIGLICVSVYLVEVAEGKEPATSSGSSGKPDSLPLHKS